VHLDKDSSWKGTFDLELPLITVLATIARSRGFAMIDRVPTDLNGTRITNLESKISELNPPEINFFEKGACGSGRFSSDPR